MHVFFSLGGVPIAAVDQGRNVLCCEPEQAYYADIVSELLRKTDTTKLSN